MSDNYEIQWREYCTKELQRITPILKSLGFELEDTQTHLGGERYLMQSVTTTSGKKLILVGRKVNTRKRVIIKATSDVEGKKEIEHERTSRSALQKLNFAYDVFFAPQEILFTEKDGFTISIQEFLEQECQFLDRPIDEQFTFALKAFKAQESAHATTNSHIQFIKKYFDSKGAREYTQLFTTFSHSIETYYKEDPEKIELIERAVKLLKDNKKTIEQYSGFLTHTDFVPHNFRIVNRVMYLLDYSSVRFGNKHEGWARFINFMELYNRELAQIVVEYVEKNRSKEEVLSLKLMRMYRLGEIIHYYISVLPKSSGNVLTLNTERVRLWTYVLESVLADKAPSQEIIDQYKKTRDSLRSAEEKLRQKGLH